MPIRPDSCDYREGATLTVGPLSEGCLLQEGCLSMARVRVDPGALQRFLNAGHSQADAARHFGVSQAAVSQRAKQTRIATSKVVAMERAAELVDPN